jgi:peptidoglycan/LPS O-acetylase OafA/YrhL
MRQFQDVPSRATGVHRALRDRLSYVPAFDGVRGVAIITVMLHNFSITGFPNPPILTSVFDWGWVGVQLFFVLSGFLVTRILLETRLSPGAFGAFLVRRALRIMPLYYATLVVYFVVLPRVLDAPTIVAAESHQIWYWLYLSNWGDPMGLGAPGLNHFWSLAVEAQFYFVWPFLVIGLGDRRLIRVFVAIVVISFLSLLSLRFGFSDAGTAIYKFTITRMGAPTIGGMAALLARRGAWRRMFERYVAPVGKVLALALVVIVVWRRGFSYQDVVVQTAGFTIVAVLFAMWLLVIVCDLPVLRGVPISWPSAAPLRAIGRVSYGMYVLHYPLHWAVMKPLHGYLLAGGDPRADLRLGAYMIVAMAVTYVLALISWRFFERPLLDLKRYFEVGRVGF